MPWYRAGTISVTNNNATVTGNGTQWVENVRVGDGLQGPDGRLYEITNVASNTALSITPPYQGSSASNQAYWIIPVQGYVKRLADRAAELIDEVNDIPAEVDSLDDRIATAEQTLAQRGTAFSRDVVTNDTDATAGRVVTSGYMGLGSGASPVVQNLDTDILNNGFYKLSSSTTVGNRPFNGPMVVMSYSSDHPGNILMTNYSIMLPRMWLSTSNQGTRSPFAEMYHTLNTTVDSNGFIKSASPIINLYSDRIDKTEHLEIADAALERVDVGHYVLTGVPLLSRNGWYIETPKDRNGNVYFTLDYEEDEATGTLTIRTYTPDYSTGPARNGQPVDILEGRFVALRFEENPALYPIEEPDDSPEDGSSDGSSSGASSG